MSDQLNLRGIPACLLPAAEPAKHNAKFSIVTEGPRNLEAAPFDYRNPHPLRDARTIAMTTGNGARTNPRIWPIDDDRPETFDYYLNSNAAVGVPGGPECALVDIFGTVRTYSGGWAFALGTDARPPALRQRTSPDPRVPVVNASQAIGTCRLDFSWFMVKPRNAPPCAYPMTGCLSYPWLSADPTGPAMYVVARCEINNPTNLAQTVAIQTGFSQQGELCAGAWYMDARRGPELTAFELNEAKGVRHVLSGFNGKERVLLGCLDTGGLAMSAGAAIAHWPETTFLAPQRPSVTCQRILSGEIPAGETLTVSWLVPYYPAAMADTAFLCAADPDEFLTDCRNEWHQRHNGRTHLRLPETKVQDVFLKALTHLDLCSVAVDNVEYPTPGPTCGHHIFYFRDSPDMIYAYDLAGEKDRAERMIAHYDRADPCIESGYFLWLAGAHWELWQDLAWLPRVLPAVERHANWIVDTWRHSRGDNDGLLPSAAVGDNEFCRGHYVSHNLYLLAGARAATAIAKALGRQDLTEPWGAFCDEFGRAVLRHIDSTAARTGGVLTPTFEGFDAEPLKAAPVHGGAVKDRSGSYGPGGGCDWHNVAAAFPTGVLPPDHLVIESSYRRWRHSYVEGLFPYPSDSDYGLLHTYNTMNLSGTWLRRGDWAEALRDLYGVLLHTSGTHAAGECVQSDLRWDFNNTPHNWFSGKFVRFMRDCIVCEGYDSRLHLLTVLSPAWMAPGAVVELSGAPTTLGRVSLRASMLDGGLDLDLDFAPRNHCAGAVLHLPPFCQNASVKTAEGPCTAVKGGWLLKPGTRHISARWKPTPLPEISFSAVVASFLADYRTRVKAAKEASVQGKEML